MIYNENTHEIVACGPGFVGVSNTLMSLIKLLHAYSMLVKLVFVAVVFSTSYLTMKIRTCPSFSVRQQTEFDQ